MNNSLIINIAHRSLTHCGRVTHICVSKPTSIGSDNGLSPGRRWPAPSHYLNQCWNIVNWTIGNKPQWNLKRNSYIFTEENAFENVVWKMAAICLGLNVSMSLSHSDGVRYTYRIIWRDNWKCYVMIIHAFFTHMNTRYDITWYLLIIFSWVI